jgi:hypothetical protein
LVGTLADAALARARNPGGGAAGEGVVTPTC